MSKTEIPSDTFAAELSAAVKGEVRFDDASRALYAADASNYRQVPIGLVVPEGIEDVLKAIAVCQKFGVPILARGAGTSLAGQCCNAAVVFDFSRNLTRILEINTSEKFARVEPGVILDQLRRLTRTDRLTFGPDPATHSRCTFGGMIGNNACGVHSVKAGKTVENIEELEILTYDGLRMRVGPTPEAELAKILREGGRRGEIYSRLKALRDRYEELIRTKYPHLPRRVSGYNLDELLPERGFHVARALVGTEGTCVTVLEAKVKLIHDPPARALLVMGFADIYEAADAVPFVLSHHPIGLEGLDEHFIQNMKKANLHPAEIDMLPQGKGWLLAEFGGETAGEAEAAAVKLMKAFHADASRPAMRLFNDPGQQKKIWSVRESSFGATVFVPGTPDTFSGFEDSAVAPEKLGGYLRDLEKLYQKFGYYAVTYGHFGDGCIHSRISFDLKTRSGISSYRKFLDEATDLVVHYGGSFSGEHGDGQTWGEFLPKMYGRELVEAFREFKSIWDPQGKMNPGKGVDSYGVTEHLRLKTYSTISQPALHFQFPPEGGNFARTTERCIGIGKCLKKDEGTMCPSYMATGEEEHSTRGRAHLLHEMMRGEVVKGGFQDEGVKHSLDLCLACKACKSECPVGVDMATYKAEFLSHYYSKKRRPLSAMAFGWIHQWARLGSFTPSFANGILQNPVLSGALKKVIGIAPERQIPQIAGRSFVSWFRKREVKNPGGPKILLWPDTFNNYFHPEVAVAATEVLEHLGYRVTVPSKPLCCGRPFYDYGMLGEAKDFLKDIMVSLKREIIKGIPIVGLEPSCIAVFRDELTNLFASDETAQALARQSFLFGEFLARYSENMKAFRFQGKALVHGHCHQKALIGMGSEKKILRGLGADFEILDAGCCGMAGAFGFEKEHYELSLQIGERVLLPRVREAAPDTLVLADGFSCREQIGQAAGRQALHLAQVLRMTIKE